MRALFDEKCKLKPIREWPDDLAAPVASVEVVRRNIDSGDGHQDVIKLKLWDKPKNIEILFKHLGLLTERVELKDPRRIRGLTIEDSAVYGPVFTAGVS